MTSTSIGGGVDLDAGEDVSAFAGQVCRASYQNSPFVKVESHGDHFRSLRTWEIVNLPARCKLTPAVDGIGTKVDLINQAESWSLAAIELFAMSAMDLTRSGALPLLFMNVLEVASLGKEGSAERRAALDLYRGLGETARKLRMVILTGETAEVGKCVGSHYPNTILPFNWSGFAIGVVDPERVITGNKLAPGQIIVASRERMFRSNGISSVRKALAVKFGEHWYERADAVEFARLAARPSVLYDNVFAKANGWYDEEFVPPVQMTAIAHLSGGGIWSKFAGDIVLARGFSAELDDLYEPPEPMRQCAEWLGAGGEDFYKYWNGGQGALTAVENEESAKLLIELHEEAGLEAKICGKIVETRDTPRVVIKSKLDGTTVTYKK